MGEGYVRIPGIYSPEQIVGRKLVTDEVHAPGGHIFLQIMHCGRIAHPQLLPGGAQAVAPSAIPPNVKTWIDGVGMVPLETPRALETDEIPGIIQEFRQATVNAFAAGLDGVEFHAASGYQPMQFLSSSSNHRTDQSGGSAVNRIRFVVEALTAMASVAGANKVAIKISPAMPFNDLTDEQAHRDLCNACKRHQRPRTGVSPRRADGPYPGLPRRTPAPLPRSLSRRCRAH